MLIFSYKIFLAKHTVDPENAESWDKISADHAELNSIVADRDAIVLKNAALLDEEEQSLWIILQGRSPQICTVRHGVTLKN